MFEIERETFLVPVIENPEIILIGLGHAGNMPELAIAVAYYRGLDLDHTGAEIRHDRRGDRTGNIARAINHQQIAKNTLFHAPPLIFLLSMRCLMQSFDAKHHGVETHQ